MAPNCTRIFKAVNQKTDNILTRITAAEANAKAFIIKHSFDSVNFESNRRIAVWQEKEAFHFCG
ncbi:MAG: hypothetical protein QM768_17880 [Agriterribacter sp.]